jgi:hypothetical protein
MGKMEDAETGACHVVVDPNLQVSSRSEKDEKQSYFIDARYLHRRCDW